MTDIKELATALAKFQSSMPVLRKTGQNFSKGVAATIGDVVTVAKKGSEFGLSYTQVIKYKFDTDGGKFVDSVETIMMHSSGQTISSGEYRVIPEKDTNQSMGSAVTYARKNSLMCLYGIADHDDDDVDWVDDKASNNAPEGLSMPSGEPSAPATTHDGDGGNHTSQGAGGTPSIDEVEKELETLTSLDEVREYFNSLDIRSVEIIKLFTQKKEALNGRK